MVKDIALLVREEMEHFTYGMSRFGRDLSGACGLSSWVLDRVCKRLGLDTTFVMGHWHKNGDHSSEYDNHCWVRHGTEIVDVTATQFGSYDKVHVTHEGDTLYQERYNGTRAKRRLATWPGGQSQVEHKVNLDAIVSRVYKKAKQLRTT